MTWINQLLLRRAKLKKVRVQAQSVQFYLYEMQWRIQSNLAFSFFSYIIIHNSKK